MLDPKLFQMVDYYISLAVKRRWLIIVPFSLAMVVGIYMSLTLPRIYQAETLILVEPQRVPADFVRSLVSIDISARLSTITQQILSRSNMEKIIKEFQLFEDEKGRSGYLSDNVESLRKRITLDITKARSGADAFAIAFRGSDPQKVQKIANALASYFIDENLKVREAQAIGTSSFLEDELDTMRKRLTEVETRLSDYRTRHMGELPDQLSTNLKIMEGLQVKLTDREQGLRTARTAMIALQNQLSQMKDFQSSALTTFDDPVDGGLAESAEIQKLRQQLAVLKTKYKESHPDVARINRIIADAEEQARQEAEANADKPEEPAGADLGTFNFADMQKTQMEQFAGEIGQQEQEIKQIKEQLEIYQRRVENSPKMEQELNALQRDYQNIHAAYSSLLNRKLESEIAVNMERKQKGEQFRIIDFARLPEKPIEPNLPRLFAMSLALGLGLGAGLVFLSDLTNPSYRLFSEIEALGLPVLAAIPTIHSDKDIYRRRLNLVFSAVALFVALALFSGFTLITFKGTDKVKAIVSQLI